ncbi:MAG TPA: cytochrome P450 [Acidimicrobiales bacterium]|jgi:cytochrome P450|nr:cytochrome P450 [Acidimicrobiales bacterium]
MSDVKIDIYSPDVYSDGPPHDAFAELRRRDPVSWQEVPGEPGYWAVLRHADLVEVAKHPLIYSAETGGVIIENPPPETLESSRRMLLMMDPPTHTHYRRPVAPRFRANVIGALEEEVRAIVTEILDEAADRREVEFVQDVAAKLPSRVFGRVMGLPEADLPHLHHLAEMLTSSQDPDFQYDGPENAAPNGASIEMAMYAIELAHTRRAMADPPDDLATMVLNTEFNGALMDDFGFGSFFVQIVTAGNDTTKTMLTAGLLSLLQHPDQLAALRSDPSGWPVAVEEILRYDNPLHYFRRTAMVDTVLNGKQIAAGDKVVMVYTSANRDETVFDRPQQFDSRRHPNPHLSFGIAEHFCLGAHLARLEARVFFEELMLRFRDFEVTGPPVRIRSNLNNAYSRAPMRLIPA